MRTARGCKNQEAGSQTQTCLTTRTHASTTTTTTAVLRTTTTADFCGYFHVNPATHKLGGNAWWFSDLPARLAAWRAKGVDVRTTPLQTPPPEWLAAYHDYFVDDSLLAAQADGGGGGGAGGASARKESARASASGRGGGGGGHPHWYSTRPVGAAARARL